MSKDTVESAISDIFGDTSRLILDMHYDSMLDQWRAVHSKKMTTTFKSLHEILKIKLEMMNKPSGVEMVRGTKYKFPLNHWDMVVMGWKVYPTYSDRSNVFGYHLPHVYAISKNDKLMNSCIIL